MTTLWALTAAMLMAGGQQSEPTGAIAASPVTDQAPVAIVASIADDGAVRLPAALPIHIEIAEPVGSNISRIDDMFLIRIGAPVMVDGKIAIPSGVIGRGQVVHAAKSGGLGKAGELILAARYIDCGETRIALRGMRFERSGKDKTGQIMALSAVVGPAALFVSGGATLVPPGTHATAKLVDAVELPLGGCIAPPGEAPAAGAPSGQTPATGLPTISPATEVAAGSTPSKH